MSQLPEPGAPESENVRPFGKPIINGPPFLAYDVAALRESASTSTAAMLMGAIVPGQGTVPLGLTAGLDAPEDTDAADGVIDPTPCPDNNPGCVRPDRGKLDAGALSGTSIFCFDVEPGSIVWGTSTRGVLALGRGVSGILPATLGDTGSIV